MRYLWLMALLVAFPAPAVEVVTLSVGDRSIRVEIPDGYNLGSQIAPLNLRSLRIQTVGINRLIDILVTDADVVDERAGRIPTQNGLVRLEITREVERVTLTVAEFRFLRDRLREMQRSDIDAILSEFGDEYRDRMSDAGTVLGVDGLDSRLPDIVPLGVYDEADRHICHSAYLTLHLILDGVEESMRYSMASCSVVLNGRMINFHHYREGARPKTLEQAKEFLLALVSRAIVLN